MAEQCGDCQRFIGQLVAMQEAKEKPGDYLKIRTEEDVVVALRTRKGQLKGGWSNSSPHYRVESAKETNSTGRFLWHVGLLCQLLGKPSS